MTERDAPGRLVPGEMFAGKFRLERQLASGGMGFVWRAWDTQLEIPVAIKVMADAMVDSPGYVARFQLEAKAAAQIRSPHVVNIYEHGVHERLPYIVMELLEGETLNDRLRRQRRLSLPATARILRDICKALHRAHELGIVHRDLKPANVFLARDVDDDIVKVLDFGIAKLTQGGGGGFVTATGELMGTPHYMSPEHIQASKHVDHRADLWSLGIIAFRALTGHLPYNGGIYEVTSQILTGPVPVASALAPDLPPAVDAFFARALARDIRDRFQSARELSEALNKLANEGAPPEPGSPTKPPGVGPDELPTVALARPSGEPPAPPAEEAAPISASSVSTVLLTDRPSKDALSGAPSGVAPSAALDDTIPPFRPKRSGVTAAIVVVLFIAVAAGLWAILSAGDAPHPPPATPSSPR